MTTTQEHWAGFDGGDNFGAKFTIRGPVRYNDDILIRLRSGRVGKYHLYSVHPVYEGAGVFNCIACAVRYEDNYDRTLAQAKVPAAGYKGARGPRPGYSGVSDVSSGAIVRPSECWQVRARNEALNRGTDSLRP